MIRGRVSALCLSLALAAVAADADEPGKAAKPQIKGIVVRGKVVDADDGRPIGRFRLIPTSDHADGRRGTWQAHLISWHEGGRYESRWPVPWDLTRFRVDAEGYRPGISRAVKKTEGEVTIDFTLTRDPGLTGVVRTPEGAPVGAARVMFATETKTAQLSGGLLKVGADERLKAAVSVTGPDGTFRLPPEADPGLVVAAHLRHGYAEVTPEATANIVVVTLRPWGRVEGRVLAGDVPVAGRLVTLGSIRPFGRDDHTISHSEEATTDAAGRFTFERVAAGRAHINRAAKTKDGWIAQSGTGSWIEVVEHGTTRITLGGAGRAVIGRLKPPTGMKRPIDWSKLSLRLFPDAPHIGWPGDDAIWAEYGRFGRSAEGQPYHRDDQRVRGDGSFRIEGVPQGNLNLQVWLAGDTNEGRKAASVAAADVEIPATADGRGDPIDVGELPIRNLDAPPE